MQQIPEIEFDLKTVKIEATTRKLRDCYRGLIRIGQKAPKLYKNLKWKHPVWVAELQRLQAIKNGDVTVERWDSVGTEEDIEQAMNQELKS